MSDDGAHCAICKCLLLEEDDSTCCEFCGRLVCVDCGYEMRDEEIDDYPGFCCDDCADKDAD